MFGVAVLQPWNAVLSLLQFFAHSSVHNPEFAFPIAMHVFIVVGMLYVMWKGPNNGSHNLKISLSFGIGGLIMVGLPWVTLIIGQNIGYYLVLAILTVFGSINGVSEALIWALAGGMPHKYIAAIMLGEGISGIISNLLRLMTLYLFPDEPSWAAVMFFSVSALMAFIASAIYTIVLKNNECFQFYLLDM